MQPTVFYRWQKEFFEDGPPPSKSKAAPISRLKRIARVSAEQDPAQKRGLLAELIGGLRRIRKRTCGTLKWGLGRARCVGPDRGFPAFSPYLNGRTLLLFQLTRNKPTIPNRT